jgi:hypothetical protein
MTSQFSVATNNIKDEHSSRMNYMAGKNQNLANCQEKD